MEFRLIYRGPLPSHSSGRGGSHLSVKHSIRKQLHGQLRELWHQHPFLKGYVQQTMDVATGKLEGYAGSYALQYVRGPYHFLPTISRRRGIACALDILFLRRDNPGNLIESGGDLDNRMKTLFDGLQIPKYDSDLVGAPSEGEEPFFVLMEDDSLIADVKITTDRLLAPLADEERIHDVHLVIHVKSKVVDDNIATGVWR